MQKGYQIMSAECLQKYVRIASTRATMVLLCDINLENVFILFLFTSDSLLLNKKSLRNSGLLKKQNFQS